MKNKSSDIPYCSVREDIIKLRNPILNDNSIRLFHKFITERYKIHIKKDVLHESAPYTSDTILKDYKFCNVRREHDRSSKWLIDHISNNKNISLEDRIYKSILYRLYNKPDTAEILDIENIDFSDSNWIHDAIAKLTEFQKSNPSYKLFTNAYKTGGTKVGAKNTAKYYYYVREVLLKNLDSKLNALFGKEEEILNLIHKLSESEDEDTLKRVEGLKKLYIKIKDYFFNEINNESKNVFLDDIIPMEECLPSVFIDNRGLEKSKVKPLYSPLTCDMTRAYTVIESLSSLLDDKELTHDYICNLLGEECNATIEYSAVADLGGYKKYKFNISNDIAPLLLINVLRYKGYANTLLQCNSQEDAYNTLKGIKGCGNFIAYQLYVDLTYIDEFPFSENEFVIAGPGCTYGIEILMENRNNFSGMTSEEIIFWIRDNIHKEFERLNLEWDPVKLFIDMPEYDKCLNVMMIENCLCEFQKYWTLYNRPHAHIRRYKAYKKEI